MSAFYPDNFKSELKEKADIVQVISQFTTLTPMGSNVFGICPFHNDHSPSMQIRPDTQTFYCHACGAGSKNHSTVQASDVYGFLKGILNVNMGGAIEWLSSFLNIPLPPMNPEEAKRENIRSQWVQYCEESGRRFHDRLLESTEGLNYLYNRGFDINDIKLWNLGLGDDQVYDFRNTKDRIVFSLYDYWGNLVSFTGRVLLPDNVLKAKNDQLKSDNKPTIVKYLDRIGLKKDDANYANHPYPEFVKGDHLYGIHIAKDFIRRFGVAIIVEGWTDIIKLHKYGAQHAVATMGVALTLNQVKLLKRAGAKSAIIMRDGDPAGEAAIQRDSKILKENGIEPLVLALSPGLDPCTVCDNFNMVDDSFARFIERYTMQLNQYRLKRIYQETHEDIVYHQSRISGLQNERMRKVIEVLSSIENPVEKDIYVRQASELFGVNYESIQAHVSHYQEKGVFMVR
ncbi:CHC2 zinc finger domain-containing protein (plasmid) [Paenibacillus urinalis]|uniref:CHC2 zinc finger domain-containing protein n=1 Tax=Paenibacillus urinalis TaxID=521520 RepID=A0ABY7XI02_9BACL|nr:CHC2 zinc finger domain-containing protein [Paenibacillus urinalis]WDI05233.1 CHC2 zinc finger domain-containing protein [Paenibacillus urinalis]